MSDNNVVRLTKKQAATANRIRQICKKQKTPPTPQVVQQAVSEVYNVNGPESARKISERLIDMPEFSKMLGFASEQAQAEIYKEIWRNIKGLNPLFPGNVDVYRDSLKLGARLSYPQATRIIIDQGKYKEMSTEELRQLADGDGPLDLDGDDKLQ